MKNLPFLLLCFWFINSSCQQAKQDKTAKNDNNVIEFISKTEAFVLLRTDDPGTDVWSQFDLDSRLGKANSTKADVFDFMAAQARDWTSNEKELITNVVNKIQKNIKELGLKINAPEKMKFIKTTCKEEGGAIGYTRADYIVLSEKFSESQLDDIEHLITHEYFHVLSRHDKAFKKAMYDIIGFTLIDNLDYPGKMKDFKITNPDAPLADSYITIKHNDQDINATMILYASGPYQGGSFFKYLKTGFLKLTDGETKEVFFDDEGLPVVLRTDEIAGFFEQVGINTNYTIHPEEILADNFTYAVLGKDDLKTPKVVEKIIEVLKAN